MYCHECGVQQTHEHGPCQMCGAELTSLSKPEPITILLDLTHFPYRAVLHSFKFMSPLLALLALPLFSLFYVFKKLLRRPLFTPILHSPTPKLHPTDAAQLPTLRRRAFHAVTAFLQQAGFVPLIDLEDVSMVNGQLQHLTYNPARHVFCAVQIHKASGKVMFFSFLALTTDQYLLSLDNTAALPIQTGERMIIKHLPFASLARTYQEFLRQLDLLPGDPQALSLASLLKTLYTLRVFVVEQGLQQHFLDVKATHTPSAAVAVRACYHHPANAAVRTCAECGIALCEACYTEFDNRVYCARCLPVAPPASAPRPERPRDAGFGIRLVAALIDLALLIGSVAGIAFGLTWLNRRVLPAGLAVLVVTRLR